MAVYACFLAVSGYIWLYLVVYGYIWPYMAVYDGCVWLHMAIYGCLSLCMAVYGCIKLHMAAYGCENAPRGAFITKISKMPRNGHTYPKNQCFWIPPSKWRKCPPGVRSSPKSVKWHEIAIRNPKKRCFWSPPGNGENAPRGGFITKISKMARNGHTYPPKTVFLERPQQMAKMPPGGLHHKNQ